MSDTTEQAGAEKLTALVSALRMEVGRSGAEEILKLLRDFNPYAIEDELPLPLPMAFADGWEEVFETLIKEASKA